MESNDKTIISTSNSNFYPTSPTEISEVVCKNSSCPSCNFEGTKREFTCLTIGEDLKFCDRVSLKMAALTINSPPVYNGIEKHISSFMTAGGIVSDYHSLASNLISCGDSLTNVTGFSNKATWAVAARNTCVYIKYNKSIANIFKSLGGSMKTPPSCHFAPTLIMRPKLKLVDLFSTKERTVDDSEIYVMPGYFPISRMFGAHKRLQISYSGKLVADLPILANHEKCLGCLCLIAKCICPTSVAVQEIETAGSRYSDNEAFYCYGLYDSLLTQGAKLKSEEKKEVVEEIIIVANQDMVPEQNMVLDEKQQKPRVSLGSGCQEAYEVVPLIKEALSSKTEIHFSDNKETIDLKIKNAVIRNFPTAEVPIEGPIIDNSILSITIDHIKGFVNTCLDLGSSISSNPLLTGFMDIMKDFLSRAFEYAKKNPRVIGYLSALALILVNHKRLYDNAICYYLDQTNNEKQQVSSVFPLDGILGIIGGQSLTTLMVSLVIQNAWGLITRNKKEAKEDSDDVSDDIFSILSFTAMSLTSFTSLCAALLICINVRAYSVASSTGKAKRFYNGLDKSEREKFTQALRATSLDAAIEKHSTSIMDDRALKLKVTKPKRKRAPRQKKVIDPEAVKDNAVVSKKTKATFKKPRVTSKPGQAPPEKNVSSRVAVKPGILKPKPCPHGDRCRYRDLNTCKFFHKLVEKHSNRNVKKRVANSKSKPKFNYEENDMTEDWREEALRERAERNEIASQWEETLEERGGKLWAEIAEENEEFYTPKNLPKWDDEYHSKKAKLVSLVSKIKRNPVTTQRLKKVKEYQNSIASLNRDYEKRLATLSDLVVEKKPQQKKKSVPKKQGEFYFPKFHGMAPKTESFTVYENGFPIDFHSKVPLASYGANIVHCKMGSDIIGYGMLVSNSYLLAPGHYPKFSSIRVLGQSRSHKRRDTPCTFVRTFGESLGLVDHLVLYQLADVVPYLKVKFNVANTHSTGVMLANSFIQVSAIELLEKEGRLQYTGDSIRGDCGQAIVDTDSGSIIGIHVAINRTASRVCIGIPFTAQLMREFADSQLFL